MCYQVKYAHGTMGPSTELYGIVLITISLDHERQKASVRQLPSPMRQSCLRRLYPPEFPGCPMAVRAWMLIRVLWKFQGRKQEAHCRYAKAQSIPAWSWLEPAQAWLVQRRPELEDRARKYEIIHKVSNIIHFLALLGSLHAFVQSSPLHGGGSS